MFFIYICMFLLQLIRPIGLATTSILYTKILKKCLELQRCNLMSGLNVRKNDNCKCIKSVY